MVLVAANLHEGSLERGYPKVVGGFASGAEVEGRGGRSRGGFAAAGITASVIRLIITMSAGMRKIQIERIVAIGEDKIHGVKGGAARAIGLRFHLSPSSGGSSSGIGSGLGVVTVIVAVVASPFVPLVPLLNSYSYEGTMASQALHGIQMRPDLVPQGE